MKSMIDSFNHLTCGAGVNNVMNTNDTIECSQLDDDTQHFVIKSNMFVIRYSKDRIDNANEK